MRTLLASDNFSSTFYLVLFLVAMFCYIGIRHSDVLGKLETHTTVMLVISCLMSGFGLVVIPLITKELSHVALVPATVCISALCGHILTMMEKERLDNKSKRRSIHYAKD